MYIFVMHIPNFVDHDCPEEFEFTTYQELLDNPLINRLAESSGFYRFSISHNRLMLELNEGKQWWVIGYILPSYDFGLPQWAPIYEKSQNV